jgi:hypothetical protein
MGELSNAKPTLKHAEDTAPTFMKVRSDRSLCLFLVDGGGGEDGEVEVEVGVEKRLAEVVGVEDVEHQRKRRRLKRRERVPTPPINEMKDPI